jgi:hypothetical protein
VVRVPETQLDAVTGLGLGARAFFLVAEAMIEAGVLVDSLETSDQLVRQMHGAPHPLGDPDATSESPRRGDPPEARRRRPVALEAHACAAPSTRSEAATPIRRTGRPVAPFASSEAARSHERAPSSHRAEPRELLKQEHVGRSTRGSDEIVATMPARARRPRRARSAPVRRREPARRDRSRRDLRLGGETAAPASLLATVDGFTAACERIRKSLPRGRIALR